MPRKWYEEAFGPHYLTVYPHRDDASARREAEFGIRALGLTPGERVLDLACGGGRHSRALAEQGLCVVGMDLSPELLAEASNRSVPRDARLDYVRGEMRTLPFRKSFAAVTLFFTSFGYFESEEEDARVLHEVARTLRAGGRVLLDAANRDHVIAGLIPESVDERSGLKIHQVRSMSPAGDRVQKKVTITGCGTAPTEYTESVRLYAPEEIIRLLEIAGFAVTSEYGDLAGGRHGSESPRFVVVGRL